MTIVAANTCIITELVTGQPVSVEMTEANSSYRAWMALDSCHTSSARSGGEGRDHGRSSNAVRAAATARSMSAVVASGVRPATSSVDALMTSMVSVPDEAT